MHINKMSYLDLLWSDADMMNGYKFGYLLWISSTFVPNAEPEITNMITILDYWYG